jgi:ketosteroid isomerase-like protein
MMLDFDTNGFVERWAAAWNAHDIPAVLAHFSEDVVFTSPIAKTIDPATKGIVRGKKALLAYWTSALEHNRNLRFEITGIFLGIDTILIRFRNENDADRIEMLRFRDGLVIEGHGTIAAPLTV